jgi:hypothetical protein
MFETSQLTATDGRSLRILDPGTLSRRSGPDFRNASVEIGGIVYSGDIEFHRHCEDWELHKHQFDRSYNSVILHVVLHGPSRTVQSESGRAIPTVILEPFLLSPVSSISDQLSREEYSTKQNGLPCAPVNDSVEQEVLNDWITVLYRERLEEKIRRMHERLDHIIQSIEHHVGEPQENYTPVPDDFPTLHRTVDQQQYQQRVVWEQLLYEELMDCLGYSNNRTPMKSLAEHLPLRQIDRLLLSVDHSNGGTVQPSPVHIEAVLFKASGLLPPVEETADIDSKVYIHALNAAWKELQPFSPASVLHHTEWNFSPTRPGNFPTIRLAAASVLAYSILRQSLFRSIIIVLEGRYSSIQSKKEQLRALLDAGDHPFWNFHYAFMEASGKKHSVLGSARVNDIIVNAIIPFASLYASVFRNDILLDHCLNITAELPLLDDNSVLRKMRSQLIKAKIPLSYAYQQQGLIQLYKRYCSAGRCSECRIGSEVFHQ